MYFVIFGNNTFLNILHLNCRSLKHNFNSLETLLCSLNSTLTAICVSETSLTADTENSFTLKGYDFVCKSKTNKIGGGVGIYIDNGLEYKVRYDLTVVNEFIECVFIEVSQSCSNFLIGCVYRPPGKELYLFKDFLVMLLDKINSKRNVPLTFLAGDFNINLLKVACHNPTNEFINVLNSYLFVPVINSQLE